MRTIIRRLPLPALCLAIASLAAAQPTANLGIFEGASDVGAPSHKGSVVYDATKKE